MKKYIITSFVIAFSLILINQAQAATPSFPTVDISASPTSLTAGGTSTISWNSQGAVSCVGQNGSTGWPGSKNLSGSFPATNLSAGSYTYNITCTNQAGYSTYKDVTVTVTAGGSGGGCGSSGCGGGCGSGCGSVPAPTVYIVASPASITYGGSSILTWGSTNAVYCSASNGGYAWFGTLGVSGSQSVSPKNTTTYNITCTNSKGQSVASSATVSVTQGCGNNCGGGGCGNNCGGNYYNGCGNNCGNQYTPPAPIITSFYASQTSILRGDSTILYWTSQNASSCVGDNALYGNVYGNLGTSGSVTVRPNFTTTYNLSCMNSIGQRASSNLTINVSNIDYNTYLTVNTNFASNVTENSATLYGTVNSSNSNSYNVTRWFEWGTSYNNLYNRTNSSYGEGSFNQYISGLSPNTTYYFKAVAQGNNGTVYGTVQQFNTPNNYNNNTCGNGLSCPPTAVTNGVSLLGTTSAQLNGAGLQDGISASMTGYFEWGTTEGFGNNTNYGSIGSGRTNNFSSTLYGLSSGTRYYYRAVVTNSYGTSKGTTRSFVTRTITTVNPPPVVVRPPVVTPVVVTNAVPSSIFLDIDRDDATVGLGDTVDYTVTWRNISGSQLSNVVIHVLVPNELDFIRASKGELSEDNRYVVLTLGSLQPGEQGSMILTTRVKLTSDINSTLVVTAEAEYTLPSGAQEQAFAYSKNTIVRGSDVSLGGLALFGNGFWPSTLLGWLILLLIILLIIWIARMAYTKVATRTPVAPVPPHSNNNPWGSPHA